MKTVKIYTYPKCPYCTQLKGLLTDAKIEFTDVNIELSENESEFKKISEISKCDQVPILIVGTQILIPDISFRSIPEAAVLTIKLLKE
jgi:glutaredoxin